jgi:signal peptidase II
MRTTDLWRWLGFAVLVVTLDRVAKYIVVQVLALGERIPVWPFFSWIHLQNEGAAFSFLSGAGGWQRWLFVAIAIGFSIYLIYEMLRLPVDKKLQGWAFALILGGAWGNLIDRILSGRVVDFVLVHYQHYYFPAFNVADSAIFLGAVAWIALMIRDSRREGSAGARSDAG